MQHLQRCTLKDVGERICKGIASPDDEAYLKSEYRKAFGVAFSGCKCTLCDAFFLIIRKKEKMSQFKIKVGVTLRIGFGDERIVNHTTITDELAHELLEKNPEYIKYFDYIPEYFYNRNKAEKVKAVVEEVIAPKPIRKRKR
jgi:hypothetical protein